MSNTILQISFKFDTSVDEHRAMVKKAARAIVKQRHLQWMIWWLDETEHESGGVFLFDDLESAQAYMQKPLTILRSDPRMSDIQAKLFAAPAALAVMPPGSRPLVNETKVLKAA